MNSYAFAIMNPDKLVTCMAPNPDEAVRKVRLIYPNCFIATVVQMNVEAHSPDVEVPPPGTPGSTPDPNNPPILYDLQPHWNPVSHVQL